MQVLHRAESRGHANFGWLQSFHTFSFGNYFHPERVHFGTLRVLNDDTVSPSMGFSTHGHDNMEIISIPIAGKIAHKDSTGTDGVINTGEVQIMSAGTGIRHSEFNPSSKEHLQFLQIWVLPKKRNITPRYDQKVFSNEARKNSFQTIVSPEESENSLWINQDAYFSLTDLDNGIELTYKLHNPQNGLYIFLIDGSIQVQAETLNKRDGIGLFGESAYMLKATQDSKVLLMEVPMN